MQKRAFILALHLALWGAPATADDAVPASPDLFDRYSSAAQELVNEGLSYIGVRYRFGGTSPETGLDCSGMVQAVFRNALGLNLPRTAHEMSRQGDKVGRQELKPGDLVFFNTMRRAFSHVGIYIGDGQFVHAPSSGGGVRVEDMSAQYWTKRFNGARRLVDESTPVISHSNGH